MPMLNIIRGLPGSGKSTFAKSFKGLNVEADMYYIHNDKYIFNKKDISHAHKFCKEIVLLAMINKVDITVSNTFTMLWEFEEYIHLADTFGYFINVYKCIGEFENIHGCPDITVQRMKDRWEDYEGEIIITEIKLPF